MTRALRRLAISVAVSVQGAFAVAAGPATAQTAFPERTVHILVGYVPAGPADIIARAIGDKLSQLWDKSVVIENVPSPATASPRRCPTGTRCCSRILRKSSSIRACSRG
jgi:hypothetical protein